MEISGKNPRAGGESDFHSLESDRQHARSKNPLDEQPPTQPDRIELSVRSREIQNLDELIRSAPDIREARVNEIKSAVEAGTYNVKAEKIADKILSGSLIDEVF